MGDRAPEPALRSPDAQPAPRRSPGMPGGRCRSTGEPRPAHPEVNSNALKHGHYTAEAITRRREIAALIRDMKQLVERVDE